MSFLGGIAQPGRAVSLQETGWEFKSLCPYVKKWIPNKQIKSWILESVPGKITLIKTGFDKVEKADPPSGANINVNPDYNKYEGVYYRY